MKKILSILFLLIQLRNYANAQIVTEDVHFDFYQTVTNNDFINHFSGGLGLTQIQTGGITGGCLESPDSVNWGNDNAIYCAHYKPAQGDTAITSICFKYDSTTAILSSYHRAISLYLNPYADFNHYVIASVPVNKKIELLTYGWNNNPYPLLNLYHNHWYNYKLSVAFFPSTDQVYLKADVFDLGLSGTGTPLFVNSSIGSFTDHILATDTAIQVSFTGTKAGGATYLDDFHFYGRKGMSTCPTATGVENIVPAQTLAAYVIQPENILHVTGNIKAGEDMIVNIYNIHGQLIMVRKTFQETLNLPLSDIPNGMYFVKCMTQRVSKTIKILVNR